MDRRRFLAGLAGVLLAPRVLAREAAEIAYPLPAVEAGTGQPLLLVHGGMADYRFWARLMEPLSSAHRVIAYSRRNHWPGPCALDATPDGAADLHADDLADFIARMNLAPVRLVAHSSGAHAALICGAKHPALIAALVVNEPPAGGMLADVAGGPEIAAAFGALLKPARDAFKAGEYDSAMRLFADAVGGPGEYDRRSAEMRQMMRDNVLAQAADALGPPRPGLDAAMAKAIAAPTLITTGAKSPPFFHAVADEIMRCVPRAERLDVPDSPHTVPDAKPEAFAEAALAFLARA